jgi:hypothetical protein
MSFNTKMTTISDKIRSRTGGTEKLGLDAIASGVDEVYEAGYTDGQTAGGGGDDRYDEGYAAGQQAEYDRLWDSLQLNGNRTDYTGAFGIVWNNDSFKPKYDIRPVNANTMFESSSITDLKAAMENAGVVLDFSQVSYARFTQFLQNSAITRIGVVDTTGTKAHKINYLFMGATNLREVEKWVITEDGTQQFDASTTFQQCTNLEEIRIEGKLGCSLSLKPCTKLSKASIQSVMNNLYDDGTGKTLTLSKTAVDNAFAGGYNGEDSAIGSETLEWDDMCQGVWLKNWTISLL